MEKITTVGIDLAKNVFSLHGVDASGKAVFKRTVRRDQLLVTVAAPPCKPPRPLGRGIHFIE